MLHPKGLLHRAGFSMVVLSSAQFMAAPFPSMIALGLHLSYFGTSQVKHSEGGGFVDGNP